MSLASRRLLRDQSGVIATWQLTTPEVRAATRAVRRGHWRRLTRHTYLSSPAEPTQRQLAWAGVLHGGPAARLAGADALVLHGWQGDTHRPVHVAVPASTARGAAPTWLRIHRLKIVKGPAGLPPRVGAHDAVAQAAAWARSDREAMFIVVSALQQGIVESRRLQAVVRGRHVRRSGLVQTIAREFSDGIQSLNELDFARLCRRFGIPEPVRQVRRLDARGICRSIDVEFEHAGHRLRVEIEGMHHMNPRNFLSDQQRHNDLVLSGEMPWLRALSLSLTLDPGAVMGDIRRGLHLQCGEEAI